MQGSKKPCILYISHLCEEISSSTCVQSVYIFKPIATRDYNMCFLSNMQWNLCKVKFLHMQDVDGMVCGKSSQVTVIVIPPCNSCTLERNAVSFGSPHDAVARYGTQNCKCEFTMLCICTSRVQQVHYVTILPARGFYVSGRWWFLKKGKHQCLLLTYMSVCVCVFICSIC